MQSGSLTNDQKRTFSHGGDAHGRRSHHGGHEATVAMRAQNQDVQIGTGCVLTDFFTGVADKENFLGVDAGFFKERLRRFGGNRKFFFLQKFHQLIYEVV